jgi:four helix bundle protein
MSLDNVNQIAHVSNDIPRTSFIVHGPFPFTFGRARAASRHMNTGTSKAAELEARLVSFAAEILSISAKLPRTLQGRHVCSQILRSGTSIAANYGEARGAESRSDFVHKLGIVLKELNETAIWLELIRRACLLPVDEIVAVLAENRELCRIITASVKSVRASSCR